MLLWEFTWASATICDGYRMADWFSDLFIAGCRYVWLRLSNAYCKVFNSLCLLRNTYWWISRKLISNLKIYKTMNWFWRFGTAIVRRGGMLHLTRNEFENDFRPIDDSCPCHSCQSYTRAYIHSILNQVHFIPYIQSFEISTFS